MTREEKIEAVEAAIELIEEGLNMVQEIAREDANFDAYVYRQIKEHIVSHNPYNQSLHSYLERLNSSENDEDHGRVLVYLIEQL